MENPPWAAGLNELLECRPDKVEVLHPLADARGSKLQAWPPGLNGMK
jgi:hypothetical protein